MNLTIKINLETSQQVEPLALQAQIKACLGENLELMFPTLTRSDVQDWSVEVVEDFFDLGGFGKKDIIQLASENGLVLSNEELTDVASLTENNFDASVGISWDSLELAMTQALMPDFRAWGSEALQNHILQYKHGVFLLGSYTVCTAEQVRDMSMNLLHTICETRFSLKIAAKMRKKE